MVSKFRSIKKITHTTRMHVRFYSKKKRFLIYSHLNLLIYNKEKQKRNALLKLIPLSLDILTLRYF